MTRHRATFRPETRGPENGARHLTWASGCRTVSNPEVGLAGKIDRIELHHVDLPLPTPFFPVWIPGYPQYRHRYTLLTVTTKDGLRGYASCPALHREREGLGDFIGQFLMGLDPYDLDEVRERLRQASFLGWRNNWIDIAFWDLAAKARGIPVHQLMVERLGGAADAPAPSSVPTYASFTELRPPRVRAESFERAMRMGFTAAKICVHAEDEAEDLEQVRAARAAVGDHFELMVHAHQAWSVSLVQRVPRWDVDRARRFLLAAAEAKLKWVQEPLHDEAWDELAALRKETGVRIAGGDLTCTFVPIRTFEQARCYDVLTPDAGFAGLGNVQRTLAVCQQADFCFSPSSYGDGFGLAANLHALVAYKRLTPGAAKARLEFPWEPPAVTPEYRDALLAEPLSIDNRGEVAVPPGPGLGIEIDPKGLKRYAERFYALTPVRLAVKTARESGIDRTADFVGRKRRRRSGSGISNSS